MIKKIAERYEILGVWVNSTTHMEVLNWLSDRLGSKQLLPLAMVTTPNAEMVTAAQSDDSFCSILNASAVALPDGMGLVWAGKILYGRPAFPERVSGVEIAQALLRLSREKGWRIFLLGGKTGVGNLIKSREMSLPGNHEIYAIETFEGAHDVRSETEAERNNTLKQIRAFRPNVLLVAYGAPWQEQWVWHNRQELEKAGVNVAMVVGGAFDILSGRLKRAPDWMQTAGLEWLWRLVLEPWRIWRQLRLVTFVYLIFKQWASGRRMKE